MLFFLYDYSNSKCEFAFKIRTTQAKLYLKLISSMSEYSCVHKRPERIKRTEGGRQTDRERERQYKEEESERSACGMKGRVKQTELKRTVRVRETQTEGQKGR